MIQARPTTYKGIHMRSRLEARVAAIMDSWTDTTWVYEPRAFANELGQYLPDFRVDGMPQAMYVEVKPTLESAYRVMPRMQIIWDSDPKAWLCLIVPVDGDQWLTLLVYGDRRNRKWLVF